MCGRLRVVLSQVKSMTYKIDTCRFLVWLGLIGQGMDWLAQCQDNVAEWNIRAWCLQHYEVVIGAHSQISIHPDMALECCKDIKLQQPINLCCPKKGDMYVMQSIMLI